MPEDYPIMPKGYKHVRVADLTTGTIYKVSDNYKGKQPITIVPAGNSAPSVGPFVFPVTGDQPVLSTKKKA